MAEEKKIPEIRFEGFSEEWKWQKLGEVVNLENGFAFKSKHFQDEPTDVIVLTPGSVNIGGGFQRGKGRFYDVAGEFPNKFIFKPDNIFVTMTDLTPTAQALGFPAVVPKDGKTYLHNQRLGKLTGFEGDKFFLFQLLSTEKNQKKVVLTSSGTTVKHTSPQKFLSIENYFPQKAEQTKIGNYFQQFDSLITHHRQKHDKLLNVKKAMLEKMFPKKGADVPEIRFKGFSEKWEEKALGEDVADIFGGGTPSTNIPEYWDGDIDWYAPTEIGNDIYANGSVKKITSVGLEKSSAKVLPANKTVLFTSRAGIGDMAILKKDGSTNQGFQSFILKNGYDAYFIYSAGYLIKEYALKYASGSTFLEISGKQLGNMKIKTPSATEQTKIGNFFKNLDTLLSLHQTELEKLKNIKKACLEKMFV